VQFRFPPQVTTISEYVLSDCQALLSVEISESIGRIELEAFEGCASLRNIAIADNVFIASNVFGRCADLRKVLGYSATNIAQGLRQRFDNLPIHKMIYYQSYNNMTVEQLNEATTMKKRVLGSNLNPSGNLQDGLGMTPLHILACSTVQNLELYKVLVTKYPENLITEDRWGAVPLLYILWGDAPDEIVQFLVESYKSIHPNYELDYNCRRGKCTTEHYSNFTGDT